MSAISAQKTALATMQPFSLWNRTGRLADMSTEIFQLGQQQMIMAPTHEEEITCLASQHIKSYRQLPLRMYQIGTKYRNEARPRGGLLRCREFLMKDLYTFDVNEEAAKRTYQEVSDAYHRIFKRIDLPIHMALASSGAIGGSLSHEFHLATPVGQDQIMHCTNCARAFNTELRHKICPHCQHGSSLQAMQGLEVGHTFYLGTKYASAFNAAFRDANNQQHLLEMGCYGIGVSRLVAACVEATHDENGIIWPTAIAPFDTYLIAASSESGYCPNLPPSSVLIDDRLEVSFSRRFKDALLSGIPNIVITGGKRSPSGLEFYKRTRNGAENVNKQVEPV